MISVLEKNPNVDIKNKIDRDINGCKVRLFFSLQPNEKTKRLILDTLMGCFDRKVQGVVSVQP
jgi:hypothetical protein